MPNFCEKRRLGVKLCKIEAQFFASNAQAAGKRREKVAKNALS